MRYKLVMISEEYTLPENSGIIQKIGFYYKKPDGTDISILHAESDGIVGEGDGIPSSVSFYVDLEIVQKVLDTTATIIGDECAEEDAAEDEGNEEDDSGEDAN
jgi:hypothetical protein